MYSLISSAILYYLATAMRQIAFIALIACLTLAVFLTVRGEASIGFWILSPCLLFAWGAYSLLASVEKYPAKKFRERCQALIGDPSFHVLMITEALKKDSKAF